MSSTSVHPLPGAKSTIVGFLIAAGIIATLALIPSTLMIAALWMIAGLQVPLLLVWLIYGLCCMLVGFYIFLMRPGKGLSANFGG